MMKRIMLSLFAVAISALPVFAAPYCGVEALPDLIKCLPAPPEPGSADFARDIARYEWGKEQRKNPERAALARHDAVWSYATVADAFSPPFGMELSPTNAPSIWKLLEDSLSTTDQMRVAPKAFYHRRRPFAYFNEEPLCPEEDGVWRDEGSYPSGHTMRSMVAALILAEINPAKANEIFVRAMQYGENRVIAGAHWQSDVDMTRIAAAIAYSRLHTLPAFRSQLELAKDEFTALRPDGRALRERPAIERIRERGVLLVGSTGDYRPLTWCDPATGRWEGFGIEIAERLAAELGVRAEFVRTSWPTLAENVRANPTLFDLAIGGITVTDARKASMAMSKGYLANGKTILCRASDAGRFRSLADIDRPDVRVMVNPGGLNEAFARAKLPNARLVVHERNEDIPALVADDRADVMVTEIVEAPWYVRHDPRLAAPLIDKPFTHGEIGVLMRSGQDDLLAFVNDVLDRMASDGSLDTLKAKHGLTPSP